MRSYNFFILIIILLSCATSQKPPEIKYDSRGRIISYFLGKIDTVYFEENSATLQALYLESISLMAKYVIENNKNVFLNSYGHELEDPKITKLRLDSVAYYFEKNGLNKSRIFMVPRNLYLSSNEDGSFTDEEKARYRYVTMQIVD